jgi:hypothetical protein
MRPNVFIKKLDTENYYEMNCYLMICNILYTNKIYKYIPSGIKNLTIVEFNKILLKETKLFDKGYDYHSILSQYYYDIISQSKDEKIILGELIDRLDNGLNISKLGYEKIQLKGHIQTHIQTQINLKIVDKIYKSPINSILDIDNVRNYLSTLFKKNIDINLIDDKLFNTFSTKQKGLIDIHLLFEYLKELIVYITQFTDNLFISEDDKTYEKYQQYRENLFKHPDETNNYENNMAYRDLLLDKQMRHNQIREIIKEKRGENSVNQLKNSINTHIHHISKSYFQLEEKILSKNVDIDIFIQNFIILFIHNILNIGSVFYLDDSSNLSIIENIYFNIEDISIPKTIILLAVIDYQLGKNMIITQFNKSSRQIRQEMFEILGDNHMVSLLTYTQKDKIKKKSVFEFLDFGLLDRDLQQTLIENGQERVLEQQIEDIMDIETRLLGTEQADISIKQSKFISDDLPIGYDMIDAFIDDDN